jgi:diguanylate cyclase (GGDEF)-like protein
VLFVDVDGFKEINDALGHRVGDDLLTELGRRLAGVARRFDTVARYGGDEFVVLATALRTAESLRVIGDRVLAAVAAGFAINGRTLMLTASVGGVVETDPAADPDDILQRADEAMYAAKQAGRSRLEIYGNHSHHDVRPLE